VFDPRANKCSFQTKSEVKKGIPGSCDNRKGSSAIGWCNEKHRRHEVTPEKAARSQARKDRKLQIEKEKEERMRREIQAEMMGTAVAASTSAPAIAVPTIVVPPSAPLSASVAPVVNSLPIVVPPVAVSIIAAPPIATLAIVAAQRPNSIAAPVDVPASVASLSTLVPVADHMEIDKAKRVDFRSQQEQARARRQEEFRRKREEQRVEREFMDDAKRLARLAREAS